MFFYSNYLDKKNDIFFFKNDRINKIIILLILYFNTFLIGNKTNIQNTLKNKISKKENLSINQNQLYNQTKSSFMSIILDSKLNSENLSNILSKCLNQSFYDVKIFVLFNSSNDERIQLIKKYQTSNKKLEYYVSNNDLWINNILEVIYSIKSKFLLFIDEFLELQNTDFYNIYKMTKGDENSIFKYSLENNKSLYLIRYKILLDILDQNDRFDNFREIINYVYSYPKPKLNYVPVSFCFSDKYTIFSYISMLSILHSKSYYTYIIFYIVIPTDFEETNIQFLESLYEQYDYFNISFIKIDNRYKNAFTARYLTIHAYFRYSLGELIPNLDKIIYFDSDTICLSDLSQFYNLNFKGKLILGRIIKIMKIGSKKYFSINTGVLLLNLKKMREIQFEKKILNILENGFGQKKTFIDKEYNAGTAILTVDQALINRYFYKYIGSLPPKFNVYAHDHYENIERIIQVNNNSGNIYDNEYLYFSFKYPFIKHFPGERKSILIKNEDWGYFARKSKYFSKINEKFCNYEKIS